MLPIAHDVAAVVTYLSLRLTPNHLSQTSVSTITTALTAMNVTAASSNDAKLNLLAGACLLILWSPEYLVQK